MKRIYGPYKGKDNRLRICIVNEDNSRSVKSYPKYIIEQYLGVELEVNEHIHHIDGNPLNNDISNLEIVYAKDHVREHSTKYKDDLQVICIYCNKNFILTPKQQRYRFRNGNEGKNGPFCSRTCSGKYGADIQNGKIKKPE